MKNAMKNDKNDKLKISLTASRIGSYFNKMCERNLLVESVSSKDLKNILKVNDTSKTDSSDAWAGNEWEKIVLERLREQEELNGDIRVLYYTGNDTKAFTYKATIDALKKLDTANPVTTYIYQPCISVEKDSSFYSEYIIDKGFDDCGLQVKFSDRMYPDFLKAEYIESESKFRITVVDVKGAKHLKSNAQIQIALYAMMLKHIVADKHIDTCYINEEFGIVWNKEPVTLNRLDHEFSLKEAFAELDKFFDETLRDICDKAAGLKDPEEYLNSLSCAISAQCEYCACYERCVDRLKREQDVRLLPYISRLAQDRLFELIETGEIPDRKIDSVKEYLEGENSAKLTDNCTFWKKIKNNLEPSTKGFKAFCDDANDNTLKYFKKGSTLGFPAYQHFGLFLTAQREVLSGRCYAYAWYLNCSRELDPFGIGLNENGYADVRYSHDVKKGEGTYYGALVAEDGDFDRIDREFVTAIYNILEKISEIGDKSLQIFVMGSYERQNIESALYNILENLDSVAEQDYMEKVMTILFWLQSEKLATDGKSQPEDIVDNPITVINSEVQKLYVLPRGIAYNLKSISAALSPDFNFEGNDSVYFEKLSDVMDGMPYVRMRQAYEASLDMNLDRAERDEKREDADRKCKSMKSHLIVRMLVERSITDAIHRDFSAGNIVLSNKAGIYRMPPKRHEGYPEIARLSFENRYEEMLKYHGARSVRMGGVDNAIDEGNILLLEYVDGDRYKVLNYDSYLGKEWFSSLLCEDTDYNRQQIMLFRDTVYEDNWMTECFTTKDDSGNYVETFYAPDFNTEFNFSDYYNEDTDSREVYMHYSVKDEDFEPVAGRRYLLFERYTNYNSPKTEAGLCKLKARPQFLEPDNLAADTGITWDNNAEALCSRFWSPDGNNFSASQKIAFTHVFERKLTVLVGPPAAGKTDFIARTVITLASYIKESEGRNMRILISANSHSAIENVLIKIAKMLTPAGVAQMPKLLNMPSNPDCLFSIRKIKEFDGNDLILRTRVEQTMERGKYGAKAMIEKDHADGYISIAGSTCWSLNKTFGVADYPFDLVIIDEASQVRAMDAFLTLEQSSDNTRFMLVGDDNQLPPIIMGKYAGSKTGEKYIHGSIFTMYLTALGENHPDIIQLNDNFRMNNVLCRYSAKKIYGDEYHAPDNIPAIGSQQIQLKSKNGMSEIVKYILDEEHPLVFCKLSGVGSEQKRAEAMLVPEIVKALWDNDLNPDGNLASSNGNFWDENHKNGNSYDGACGIISPHHEHINRIRSAVANELSCAESGIFIGTVDKLQGRERRNVIVSYGVYDRETIEKESEFIFSLNRFNVSLTRGKAKTIVILSDVIANSSLTSNNLMGESEDGGAGIDFVQGFTDYMAHTENGDAVNSRNFEYLDGNVEIEIWRK